MTRILLTGASGFLGAHFLALHQDRFDILGTHMSHAPAGPADRSRTVRLDLRDQEAVRGVFDSFRPQAVVHAAALSNPNECQKDPELSRAVNMEATAFLAQICADRGLPFLFTSTDLVFDGEAAPYREEDRPAPVSLYGEHKALAEEEVLKRHPGATVCRMPLMYGASGPCNPSFLHFMQRAVAEGRELALFTDEWRTPATGEDGARGLVLALTRGVTGLLHLGGPERATRYEFGEIFRQVLGNPDIRLAGCLRRDVPMPAPRPRDVSLDSGRAFALGYAPSGIEEGLRRAVAQGLE